MEFFILWWEVQLIGICSPCVEYLERPDLAVINLVGESVGGNVLVP